MNQNNTEYHESATKKQESRGNEIMETTTILTIEVTIIDKTSKEEFEKYFEESEYEELKKNLEAAAKDFIQKSIRPVPDDVHVTSKLFVREEKNDD